MVVVLHLLLENFSFLQDPYASYDVNDQDNDPMPRYDNTNENRQVYGEGYNGLRIGSTLSFTASGSRS